MEANNSARSPTAETVRTAPSTPPSDPIPMGFVIRNPSWRKRSLLPPIDPGWKSSATTARTMRIATSRATTSHRRDFARPFGNRRKTRTIEPMARSGNQLDAYPIQSASDSEPGAVTNARTGYSSPTAR